MKFLLTNDDGVDAPGLAALGAAASELGPRLIIAPAGAYSGCGHRVTTDQPFRVSERHAGCLVVEGTPADCVRVGLHGPGKDVEWVLSGVNHGGNLGTDVFHSGTVAAVREAALHGLPGIAVSHYRRRGVAEIDWMRAARWLTPLLHDLVSRPREPGTFWNINLPCLDLAAPDPPVVFCPLDVSPLPVSFLAEAELWRYNGIYQNRQRLAGHDVETCFNGQIAVTLLRLL